jgi:hypothetical protein
MKGFDLIALDDVDDTMMHGGDSVVVLQFDYHRK